MPSAPHLVSLLLVVSPVEGAPLSLPNMTDLFSSLKIPSSSVSASDFAASIASDKVDDMRRTVETYTIPPMYWTTGTYTSAPSTKPPKVTKPPKAAKTTTVKAGQQSVDKSPVTQASSATLPTDLSNYCTKHNDCTHLGKQFICDLGDLGGTYQCIWVTETPDVKASQPNPIVCFSQEDCLKLGDKFMCDTAEWRGTNKCVWMDGIATASKDTGSTSCVSHSDCSKDMGVGYMCDNQDFEGTFKCIFRAPKEQARPPTLMDTIG